MFFKAFLCRLRTNAAEPIQAIRLSKLRPKFLSLMSDHSAPISSGHQKNAAQRIKGKNAIDALRRKIEQPTAAQGGVIRCAVRFLHVADHGARVWRMCAGSYCCAGRGWHLSCDKFGYFACSVPRHFGYREQP